jgi:hypothetical protein
MWQSLWQNRKRQPYKPALTNNRLSSVAIVQRIYLAERQVLFLSKTMEWLCGYKKARESGLLKCVGLQLKISV